MKITRLSLVAHRTVGFAVCSLLILVLHGSFIEHVKSQETSKGSNNLIRVWTVGSPHRGDLPPAVVPPQLQRQAENLGYTIEVKTFQAAGFAAKFRQALQENEEPEVLTFNNYGLIVGFSTPMGGVEGFGSASQSLVSVREALAQLQPVGWVMLVRSAVNYEGAKALSMQPPVCGTESGRAADSPTLPELGRAKEAAVAAARAYLLCDQTSLSAISDESRLGKKCYWPESDTKVQVVKACSVAGNNNLAFVSLVGSFTAQVREPRRDAEMAPDKALGRQSLLAILRNQGGVWRLLAITADPVNTVQPRPLTTERIGVLLENGESKDISFAPARLLTPNGVYPGGRASGDRFGDFTWEPAESTEVIGQVVEFMWGPKGGSGQTRLFFLSERESKLSSGYLMSGGATRWRVWSVSKSGEVAFSEEHAFVN